MTWTRIDHEDRGPEFVFRDWSGNEVMRAFFGGSSLPILQDGPVDPARQLCVNVLLDPEDDTYAHFCNLEEHIAHMQALATALREWDQAKYARQAAKQLPDGEPWTSAYAWSKGS